MKHETHAVTLPNGIRLPYAAQGDPSGVPVLLLHGYTDSWRSFEPVLAHLPRSLRAYAPTQRGHGDADRPATGYRPRDFAADLAAFMDALDIARAVVVGHSMGSQIAQRFAIDNPDRTLALALIGAFRTLRGNAAIQELWDSAVSSLEDPIDPGFVRAFQESTLAEPVPAAFLDTVVKESLKVPARVWRAALQGMQTDDPGELGRIKGPTLILWGDRDGLCSRSEQETLMTSIAGSGLQVHPGAGHGLHWEQPDRVAAALAALIERAVLAEAVSR